MSEIVEKTKNGTISKIIQQNRDKLVTLQIVGGPKHGKEVPVFSFTNLNLDEQINIAKQLANSAIEEGYELVYDVGYGTTNSPADIAGSQNNMVVLGFDPEGIFSDKHRAGTENIKLPSPESNSMAVFFKIGLSDVVKGDFPIASRLQSIAPFPNMVSDFIQLGCQVAKDVYITLNPNNFVAYPPIDIVEGVPKNIQATLETLSRERLEKVTGTSESLYLGSESNQQERIEVIHAHLK